MVISTEATRYDKLIKDALGRDTTVNGNYSFPNKSKTINVDEKDLTNFQKLYKLTGGSQCIGYGEIALYWLFQGRLQPAGEIDLVKGSYNIDVKSYASNGFLTLGKWKDNTKTRNIVNNLFSCYNLLNDDFKSELNISTTHITDAIHENIFMHSELLQVENPPLGIQKMLVTMDKLTQQFKYLAAKRGREFVEVNDNSDESVVDYIVNESIADLVYGLVHYKLFESPTAIGKNGYIINVVKDNSVATGEIQVHRIRGLSKKTDPLHKNFSVISGEIKIRPDILIHV